MIDLLKFDRPEQFPKDEILNDSDRLVRSWASVEVTDKQGDIVPISEMKKVLNTWFKRGATMIDQHSNRPIGRGLRWQEMKHPETGKQGIVIDYQVFNDYSLDDEVWDDIKAGKRTGLSIGGRSTGKTEVKMDDYTNKPGKFLSGLELYEISAVDNPANQFGKNIAINYLAKSDKGLSPEALAKKLLNDLSKGFVVKDAEQAFAGFKSMDDCVSAQLKRGHSEESAKRIATFLMHQTNKDWVAESKEEGKVSVQGSLKDERDDLISKCDAAIKKKGSFKNLEKASWLDKKPLRKGGWKMKDKNDLMKRRVYLKPGQEAPSGVNVQEGKHGGKYYETQGGSSGEGKPKPGEAPQREGEMPDFSGWGYDANSKEESEDFNGEPIGVGSEVLVHPELTHDPANKKGEKGIVVGLNEQGDVLVEFMDGEYGAYTSDSLVDQTAMGAARDAGDVPDIAEDENNILSSFNEGNLNSLEHDIYADALNSGANKTEALQRVIDSVEGDYSQLSDELAEVAEQLDGGNQPNDDPGSGKKIESLMRNNRAAYNALMEAENSEVEELANTYYGSQLREAAEHTDREDIKSKLEAAAEVSDDQESDAESEQAMREDARRFEDGEREQEDIDEAQRAHAERASRNQRSSKAVQAFEGAGGAFNASELAHRFSAEDLKQALRMAEDNPIVAGSKGIAALRSAIPKAEKSDAENASRNQATGNSFDVEPGFEPPKREKLPFERNKPSKGSSVTMNDARDSYDQKESEWVGEVIDDDYAGQMVVQWKGKGAPRHPVVINPDALKTKNDKSKSCKPEKEEGNVKKNTWPEDITKELNKPIKKSAWPTEIIKSLIKPKDLNNKTYKTKK